MASNTSTNKKKILIVDDERTAHQLYKIMVEDDNILFYHAYSGKEALSIAREHPDIKLILMDIKMPEMDGYEATREIRTFSQDVPIVAQTAYNLPSDIKKAKEAGCDEHLAKPVDRSTIMDMIKKYCYNQSG